MKKYLVILGFLANLITPFQSSYGIQNNIFNDSEDSFETSEEVNHLESDVFDSLNNKAENNIPIIDSVKPSLTTKVHNKAKIIALNKITSKSRELTIEIGESQYFGNIEIKLYKCIKNLDPYNPDNKILLTVTENKIDEDQNIIFQGWLMSSSISLSTFEHPVYEIFAKDCL